ncbi:MAG: hypothetical protein IIU14_03665 [Ruminococcus sp.]|nr:hypothetical protein [Ruminococcus sp.]
MKTKLQKFLGIFLSLTMVISLVPVTAFADDGEEGSGGAHTFSQPTYVWADDLKSCLAEMVCEDDPELTVRENSENISLSEHKDATCEEKGFDKYEAVFENESFTKQEKLVEIDKLGHDWGEWEVDTPASEGKAGKEIRRCKRDESHFEERDIPAIIVEFKLWVNGEQISTDNKEVACGKGTAVFDSSSNTLTLDNAEIKTPHEYSKDKKALIYSGVRNLTIVLKGESSLVGNEETPDGFVAANGCNLNVRGDGKLSVNDTAYGIYIEGGDFDCDSSELEIASKNSSGLWVGRNITFTRATAKISTNSPYFNAVNSDVDGTITVTDSDVEVSSKKAAVRFGGGDDDNTLHQLVLNSGSLKIESGSDYGILVWNYYNPATGLAAPNGKIIVNGGTLDVTSASGAANVGDVTIADKMNFASGEALSDSGRVVLTDGVVEYKLWVNSQRITSEKTEVKCGDGKAVYDAKRRTLTLSGATVSKAYEFVEKNSAFIYSEIHHLDIELEGENKLEGEATYGINTAKGCDLCIVGNGSLSVASVDNGVRVGDEQDDKGSLNINDAVVKIRAKSGTGLWVRKDIDISKSDVEVLTDSPYFNAVVCNYDGTVTLTDTKLSASSKRAAIHFGNGDEDYSEHNFVMNSGTLKLESLADYAIFVDNSRDPYSGETALNGSVHVNGRVELNSMFGGTNLPKESITYGRDMVFTYGDSLCDGGKVVVKPKDMIFPSYVVKKDATCTEDGVQAHYEDGKLLFRDKDGNEPVTAELLIIPATGHRWGEPEYEWDDETKTVTGKVVCENDETHVEIETVEYTTITVKGPSCSEEGQTLDIADFKGELFKKQVSRPHAIPKTEHKWGEPKYEWADDYSSCTARVVCKNDPEHILEETVTDIPVTQLEGETTYTAMFENSVFGMSTITIKDTPTLPEPITETTEPTTAEPTQAPTTVEPTEPTTAEPTTVEPTEAPTQKATEKPKTEKKENPVSVKKSKTKTLRKKTLKAKKLSAKLITIKNAKGSVKVVKIRNGKNDKLFNKIKVNSKTGEITFKKGKYSKGTFKIKLKITVSGNSAYKKKTLKATVRVRIK